MAGNKWSEDTTIKFVSEYVSHECLWNGKHPLYKNKLARMAAYRDIANAMNLPNVGEKEIVIKIKNIRSTYCQELKKIKESDNYVPNLKWFSILHSIKKSNLENPKLENADDSSFQEDNYNNGTSSQVNSEDPLENTVRKPEQPRSLKRRRLQELSSLLSKVKEVSAINNAPPPEEHEFDIFGRSVAAQLKMLPLEKALQAQHFIQSHLTALRLQGSPASPSPSYNELPYSPQGVIKSEQVSP